MKRAAIYARQSHTNEGSASLAIQMETCRETANRFDLEVTHELIEPPSTSGFQNRGRNRSKFKELLGLIESGAIDAVVVYSTDRLSRGGGPGWAPVL
jgi:DNA invertase Pin-like site-specific DNA recombinase